MGFSGGSGRVVRQFSSRLHVLQSRLVACTFRFCCCLVSLVLGTYAPNPWHRTMGAPRAHCRSDGRRLLSQRRLPSPSAHRISVGLLRLSKNWSPRCPESFCAKPALPFQHFCRHDAHLHHKKNHFWRLLAFWRLSQSRLGLVGAPLALRALFLGSRPA